jgi:hypothetical protein
MAAMALTDAELDLEFTWTPFDVPRCRDPYTLDQQCRRPAGHSDEHASGFGASRVRW